MPRPDRAPKHRTQAGLTVVVEGVRSLAIAATMALAASLLPHPAHAQTLRGTVLDAVTGEPVMLAQVSLLEEGRSEVAADLADFDGDFDLEAPTTGSYFLYIRRDGYHTLLEGLFELGSGGVMEVRVGMKPEPIELEGVDVEAVRMKTPLEASGFFDRLVTAPGYFLTRDDIQRIGGSQVADVFQTVPRVEIDATRPLTGPEVMQNPSIFMRSGADPCYPTLYVDRHVVATGINAAVRPDDWVNPGEVEAIEIYARASQVPPEFDAINDCGVVLIWTRSR